MSETMNVFDRRLLRRRRDRAAGRPEQHDFLWREVAERLADRLDDVKRRFPLALDLGCHDGVLGRLLGPRGGIETLVQCDLSPAMARAARTPGRPTLAADEEALPFAAGCFDLACSVLSLHWTNDLPGALLQIRQALKPDGLFLAAMLGGETLHELRGALMQAEIELEQGASPRVSPFAELRDAGGLLQRAGFALPVVDRDTITVTYPHPLALMAELRAMGESNAVQARLRRPTRRGTLLRAAQLYQEAHGDAGGRVPASFQVIYMTGWAPHASQQQPLKPGSAAARLAEALGAEEVSAGEKAEPR
ncbi:MAG: methyltransferase domain-containing protein [Rhodospirillales bacterium]|nr:methyltransferase domain-containing protein [Rhodospirillales bacterium]